MWYMGEGERGRGKEAGQGEGFWSALRVAASNVPFGMWGFFFCCSSWGWGRDFDERVLGCCEGLRGWNEGFFLRFLLFFSVFPAENVTVK